MNSLYRQLTQRAVPQNAKQLISQIKSLANPQVAIQKMLNDNPQAQALIQAANGDPERAFRDLAARMNVNPDEVIDLLRY